MDTWEETTGIRRPYPMDESPEASSKPAEKQWQSSMLSEIADLEAKLAPPSMEEVMAELSRCLRLTVPAGMTQADRLEWLLVAVPEVEAISRCEFFDRCAHARKTADHPAKIVPEIHKFKPLSFASAGWYRRRLSELRGQWDNRNAPRIEQREASEDERREIAVGMAELVKELEAKARQQMEAPA